ncbi:MAG: type II toxin-antitoxin system VapC family toxin [Gammaproteobacteria bacterium]
MRELEHVIERGVILCHHGRLCESFAILLPDGADFATAVKYLEMPKSGLRAGDALHLAIAANHGARKIITLDRGFLDAGKLLKLPVSRGIRI